MRTRTTGTLVGLMVVALFVVAPLLVAAAARPDRSRELRRAIDDGYAKNVILLIGDGMGDSEITIARNYAVGAAGRLALDSLPFTGAMTTYAVQEDDPTSPEYLSESASTATAWSTGVKTANGRISTSAKTDQDLTTIIELAEQAGIRTGIVTTSELTDATPAAPAAHVSSRSCQGPADMAACPQDRVAAGGPGSIAEQMVKAKNIDVLLGGGKQRFDQPIDGGPNRGKTVVEAAIANGYPLVTTAAELDGANPINKKLLGLFAPGNMALEWSGLPAALGGTPAQRCSENQRPAEQPSLAAMTTKAISLLSQAQVGRGGFLLQVEGASIDKQDHAANPCGQIGETVAFDQAVKVALDFAAKTPRTLVIVTADHAHTSQIIATDSSSPGVTSTLITDEGVAMTINYGTSGAGQSQQHTGAQVRVAAQGPQAANVVGVIDQTELFTIITRALRIGAYR